MGDVFTRLIRHAIGLRSTPIDGRPLYCAASNVVPDPQNGSRTMVPDGGAIISSKVPGISEMNFAG